jgi:hypothetical protein
VFIPVKSPKLQPVLTVVNNDPYTGTMVVNNDQTITGRHDEYSFTMNAYMDTLSYLMRGILGSTDTITGSATPYTHVISLLNSDPLNGNQPPSYTFFDYDGYVLRTMAGGQLDEISISFTALGLVEVSVKAQTLPYTTTGTIPSTSFSTVNAAPSWSTTATLNSVSTTTLVNGSISFKRGVKALHGLGSLAPFQLFAGALDSSGGALTVINRADTEQNLALAGTAFPLTLVFSSPDLAAQSLTFQFTKVKASATHQERGGDGAITTAVNWQALPNSTDATTAGGGRSPVKYIALTALATTY